MKCDAECSNKNCKAKVEKGETCACVDYSDKCESYKSIDPTHEEKHKASVKHIARVLPRSGDYNF